MGLNLKVDWDLNCGDLFESFFFFFIYKFTGVFLLLRLRLLLRRRLLPLSGHSQCMIILPLSGGSAILHKSYLLQNGQKYNLIINPNCGGAACRLPTFALQLLY